MVNNNLIITISGIQNNNYKLNNTTTSGSIISKLVYAIFNNTKPYDGTTNITLTATISGLAPRDDPVTFNLLSPYYPAFNLGYYGMLPWGSASLFIDISLLKLIIVNIPL